jgi:hypothetical protein
MISCMLIFMLSNINVKVYFIIIIQLRDILHLKYQDAIK